MRYSEIERNTTETRIRLSLELDGEGKYELNTGIGFFDHVLTLFTRHSMFDMSVAVDGDLEVDGHHTVEDLGIVLGKALNEALGDKVGIRRFASETVVMDETLVTVSLDISARPYLVCNTPPLSGSLGGFDCELLEEFLRALAVNGGLTLHVNVPYGVNRHHILEATFKALGRALRFASETDERAKGLLPSTKGLLSL